MKDRDPQAVTVLVVLYEDTYESLYGDGKYIYLKGVFLSGKDGLEYIDDHKEEWIRLYLRPTTLKIEHGVFVFPDLVPEIFEHYGPEGVLSALERRRGNKRR